MATLFEYKCKKCGYTVKGNPKVRDSSCIQDMKLIRGVFKEHKSKNPTTWWSDIITLK